MAGRDDADKGEELGHFGKLRGEPGPIGEWGIRVEEGRESEKNQSPKIFVKMVLPARGWAPSFRARRKANYRWSGSSVG